MNGNFKKQNEEYYKPHFYFSNKANKEDEKGQVLKADCWISPAQYIENEETDKWQEINQSIAEVARLFQKYNLRLQVSIQDKKNATSWQQFKKIAKVNLYLSENHEILKLTPAHKQETPTEEPSIIKEEFDDEIPF